MMNKLPLKIITAGEKKLWEIPPTHVLQVNRYEVFFLVRHNTNCKINSSEKGRIFDPFKSINTKLSIPNKQKHDKKFNH